MNCEPAQSAQQFTVLEGFLPYGVLSETEMLSSSWVLLINPLGKEKEMSNTKAFPV